MYFAPLAATAEEARAIKGCFPRRRSSTGRRATKAALQRVEAPRACCISPRMHSFCEDAHGQPAESAAALGPGARRREPAARLA